MSWWYGVQVIDHTRRSADGNTSLNRIVFKGYPWFSCARFQARWLRSIYREPRFSVMCFGYDPSK